MYIVTSTSVWDTTYITMGWNDQWDWTVIRDDAYIFSDKALAVTVATLMCNLGAYVRVENLHDYECFQCGNIIKVIHGIHEEPNIKCGACGNTAMTEEHRGA